jgi:hypothetical protein
LTLLCVLLCDNNLFDLEYCLLQTLSLLSHWHCFSTVCSQIMSWSNVKTFLASLVYTWCACLYHDWFLAVTHAVCCLNKFSHVGMFARIIIDFFTKSTWHYLTFISFVSEVVPLVYNPSPLRPSLATHLPMKHYNLKMETILFHYSVIALYFFIIYMLKYRLTYVQFN